MSEPAAVEDTVLTRDEGRVRCIQINRPQKKNALTQAMYVALADAIAQAEADPNVRALLLLGADTAFSAGNDIGDFLSNFRMDASSPVYRFLHGLMDAQKPVVAGVSGVAVGVGTTMLLHCDLVYCGRSARFQLPFVNLGLVPEAGSSLLLPALLGQRRAAALLLLADAFDAETALACGIVNAIVADGEVTSHALAAAQRLSEKSPEAMRLSKQLMKRWSRDEIAAAMEAEAAVFAQRLQSPEVTQAMQAFVQRR